MSKILVVDDEAIISMQLGELLETLGYTVVGLAASGEDAIEKARKFSPDLILMDIVMPKKLNGIEAAQVIIREMDIPVVFVTSYADDAIIEKAKQVRPYGYIVKPFNELEIKAAIEVALFRKATEREMNRIAGPNQVTTPPGNLPAITEKPDTYLGQPEVTLVLLKDIFSEIILFLYVDPSVKDPLFKSAIEAGIKKGGRNFFAYHQSSLNKFFYKEIQEGKLFTRRIKKGEFFLLPRILEKCTETLNPEDPSDNLRIFFDFSYTEDFADIIALKKLIYSKKEAGIPITGILSQNIADLDHNHIRLLSEGITKIIISTGKDTNLFIDNPAFQVESLTILPQATIEEVVRKLIEPVILSMLEKPVSGYDIVQEIHNRYKVLISQARIYTFLYELQNKGYLEIKISGRSKLYYPTETGKKYIRQQLTNFKVVFQLILGEEYSASKKKD